MPQIDLSILNQRQTPAFYADIFANRPAAGFIGRIFVSTNTFAFYRDNGTGWDLIGGPGTGTITGSGTAGTIPLWNGASTIGDSILTQSGSTVELKATGGLDAVLNIDTTTGDFSRIEFQNNGNLRARAYFIESINQLVYGTYSTGGAIRFETDNNISAVLIDSSQNTTFYGNIIRNGGTSSQFLKADGSLDSSAYVTTNIYNGNGTLSAERTVSLNGHNLIFDGGASVARVRLDADTNVARIFSFATNNVARWAFRIDDAEIGSNAGSNFAVRRYDDAGAFVDSPLLINRATGQSTFAKKVVIENNAGDQQLQIVSTTAPSLRIDNLQTSATKRAGLGLATTVNNFIQGSVDRDFCVFNSSTTASPILFGIYDAGLTNTQEAARISAARNFLIGTSVDSGTYGKVQIAGGLKIVNDNNAKFEIGRFSSGIPNSYIKLGPNSNSFRITDNNDQFDLLYLTNGGNLSIGSTPNPTYRLEVSADGGSQRIRVGTLQNNNNTAQFEAITSSATTTANSSWLRVNYLGGFTLGTSSYTKTGGDSGNFANISGEVASPQVTLSPSSNLLIGTTTDAGQKLQVNGTGQFSNTVKAFCPTTANQSGFIVQASDSGGPGSQPGLLFLDNTSASRYSLYYDVTSNTLNVGNNVGANYLTIKSTGVINLQNVPTSATGLVSGDIYRLGTVLNIVP
jgi:hypothetical protein